MGTTTTKKDRVVYIKIGYDNIYIYILYLYIHIMYVYTLYTYIYIYIYVSNWNHRVALSKPPTNSSNFPAELRCGPQRCFDATAPDGPGDPLGDPRGCIPLLGAMVYPLGN